MIEYLAITEETVQSAHFRAENGTYTMGWNDGIKTLREKAQNLKAVPEEAFEDTIKTIKTWIRETEFKKDLAIADQDSSTAEIKARELITYKFALNIVEELSKYVEREEMMCGDD